MKKLNNREIKKELLNILKDFDKFCNDNNIKYSLIGGSLLGAVRHKGFIPWDDDIDVILTKDNYDKFLKCIKNYKGKYSFINNEINNDYYYPFLKMINNNVQINEKYKKIKNYGLYIDIFCYVNVPNNKILFNIFWYKIRFYKFLISSYAFNNNKKSNYFYLKKIGIQVCKIFGIHNVIKRYNKIINSYCNKKCDRVMINWPGYKKYKEVQKITNIKEYIDTKFEGMDSLIFKDYDVILKQTFNNYMILPPENERNNHGIIAYKK